MDIVKVLHELQGERSQVEFAELIGVSQPLLSMIYARQRSVGKAMISRLIQVFPERKGELVDLFLSSDYNKTDSSIASDTKSISQEAA